MDRVYRAVAWQHIDQIRYNIMMFVFQDIDGAKDYFKRKVSFVEEQIEKITQMSVEKNELNKGICAFFLQVL
jgi:hypothetical protein